MRIRVLSLIVYVKTCANACIDAGRQFEKPYELSKRAGEGNDHQTRCFKEAFKGGSRCADAGIDRIGGGTFAPTEGVASRRYRERLRSGIEGFRRRGAVRWPYVALEYRCERCVCW